MLLCWYSTKKDPKNERESAMAQQKLQTERVTKLESTLEREARPPAGKDERPAAPLQDVGRGPPQAEAAR